jgi:ABC-type Na+ efflux pump permease subunit
LPNIESILKPGEQELLQAKTDTTVHLQEIDEAIKDAIKIKNRATLDVTTVLDNLRRVDSTSTSTVYLVTGISIFIIFFSVLLCYYYRHSMLTN